MNQSISSNQWSEGYKNNRKRWIVAIVIFLLITMAGLFYAKWYPYFHKAFSVAVNHTMGSSILLTGHESLPSPSLAAAWQYGLTYFKSIWVAFVVAIVIASLVQVLVPRDWIQRIIGKTSFGSTWLAGLCGLPSMMCTCCSAPIVVGLRRQQSSVAAATAFWFANTALNPAVLIFMFFVLGWKFLILRLLFGIVIVFGLSYLAGRIVEGKENTRELMSRFSAATTGKSSNENLHETFWIRWMKSLGTMSVNIIPVYLISVFALGAFRAWLFPVLGGTVWGDSILAMIGFAIAGTLFVIPTAAEIPIVQTFMNVGLGGGAAAALIITLPVISLPSALMVRKALTVRTLLVLGAGVALIGVLAGLVGQVLI